VGADNRQRLQISRPPGDDAHPRRASSGTRRGVAR
jgi:hypothetical protein